MLQTIHLQTPERQTLVLFTQELQKIVDDSGCTNGLCLVFCPHSTAGLTINSYLDPATALDLRGELDRLIPTRVDFHHIFDTPSDAAAHVKAMLTGTECMLIIEEGNVFLGDSQGIFLCEFDGPRQRKVFVKIVPSVND